LVRSAVVGIGVVSTTSIILNGYRLHVHVEWSLGEVNSTTSPVAGTLGSWVAGIETTWPVTHSDTHRSLRVSGTGVGKRISVAQSADSGTVDGPDDAIRGPIDHIGVEVLNWRGNIVVLSSVVGAGITLSEKVTLD